MDKYCKNCGAELDQNVKFCPKCGIKVGKIEIETYQTTRSKIAAGLFGIFLGYLGIHNFYLGYNGKGAAQLILTLVGWIACGLGPVIAGIWGLIEGILILTGSINRDANGNELQN